MITVKQNWKNVELIGSEKGLWFRRLPSGGRSVAQQVKTRADRRRNGWRILMWRKPSNFAMTARNGRCKDKTNVFERKIHDSTFITKMPLKKNSGKETPARLEPIWQEVGVSYWTLHPARTQANTTCKSHSNQFVIVTFCGLTSQNVNPLAKESAVVN